MRALPKSFRKSRVFRITVDEMLDKSAVRILVAPQVEGAQEIPVDDLACWRDEHPVIATEDDCLTKMGLRGKELVAAALEAVGGAPSAGKAARVEFWNGIAEGQVFLVGYFDVARRRAGPKTVTVRRSGPKRLLRIDRLDEVKESAKKLYAEAITGKEVPRGQDQG